MDVQSPPPLDPGSPDDVRAISTRKEFAETLSRLRERAGFTVRDLARAVDLPPATLGGYLSGRHLPGAKPPHLLMDILAGCGVTDPGVVRAWHDALARVRRVPGPRPAGAPVPYRGLDSFQAEHAEWYFGREEMTGQLLEELDRRCTAGGVTIVIGPSGAGKSSLMHAGAVATLRRGDGPIPGGQDLPVILLKPGAHPVKTLADKLAGIAGIEAEALAIEIRSQPSDLGYRLSTAPACQPRAVLVVDQLEEIFTECGADEQRTFIAAICAAAQPPDPALLVVIGLRADFYDHAVRTPQLATALQQPHVVVGPLTEPQLRRAIVEPARRANLHVEDELVELLLHDFFPQAAAGQLADASATTSLPLLSHALLATWQRSRGGRLTVADYHQTGGVRSAVAHSAEDVYAALNDVQRELARDLFLRLIHVTSATAPTRRRVRAEELTDDSATMLERFVEARLVTAHAGQVEITHEAMLTAWPRLKEWIENDISGLRQHRQVTEAAQIWQDAGRDPLTLIRGVRLAAAREWLATSTRRANLNQLEREFLDRSVEHDLAEGRAAQRRTRRLIQLSAALAVLLVATVTLAVVASRQRDAADHERDLAVSRQIATVANQLRATDPGLAMQLSLAAYQTAPVLESRSSLLSSYASPTATRILGPKGVMQTLAVDPDATTLATAGPDFAVRLWDVSNRDKPRMRGAPLRGHTETIFASAFNPGGTLLATGGGDRTVRLWDITSADGPLAIHTLSGAANTIYSLAFSPDGSTLAAGSADKSVHRWRLTGVQAPVEIVPPLPATDYVHAVAFSPDGRTLAAGSADLTVRLWDVAATPAAAIGAPLTGPAKTVFSVAFSPDGRNLAAGSADKTVWIWDVSDRTLPRPGTPLTGANGWVNSVSFNADGRQLAAGSSDGAARIWDTTTKRIISLLPHPGPVTSVTFAADALVTSAADGTARLWRLPGPMLAGAAEGVFNTGFAAGTPLLAVASSDNTVSLWNVTDPGRPARVGYPLTNSSVRSRSSGAAALSPDARTLAVGAVDGSIQLWDVADAAHPAAIPTRMNAHTAPIQALCFSPDGLTLAAASEDRTATLWDLSSPHDPRRLGSPLTGPQNYAYSPVFSPDGRIFALGGADRKIRLWDVSDLARPVPIGAPLDGPTSYVFSVAFSPDGRTLAAGSADNTVRLWNLSDPHRPRPIGTAMTGPDNYVYSVAFTADGRTLAAGAGDGTIWLWNVADRRRPSAFATITGHAGSTYIVKFDSRHTLASGGADRLARLWSIDPDHVAARICQTAGDLITPDEWRKYVPGRPFRRPC